MPVETSCWFTATKTAKQTHPKFEAKVFESDGCGRYIVSRSLIYSEAFKRAQEDNRPPVSQGDISQVFIREGAVRYEYASRRNDDLQHGKPRTIREEANFRADFYQFSFKGDAGLVKWELFYPRLR